MEVLGRVDSQSKCNTFSNRWESGNTDCFLIRQEGVATMAYSQLSQAERYAINKERASGVSLRRVAARLGRSPSTISGELKRNATHHDGAYRPEKAHKYAMARRRRSRRGSQYSLQEWAEVLHLLRQRWSPEQIHGWHERKGRASMSHETIYRYVRRDRGDAQGLRRCMRHMGKFARKRYRSEDSRGVQPGKRHISERPQGVEGRRTFGHWEGDTVMGADMRHCVLTLVERKSGYTLIKKMSARTKHEANQALARALIRLNGRMKTLTLDNGTEFHGYQELERMFPLKCYFATPYHSWERGTNENTNGLIRQYLPKGHCMKALTQAECDRIAQQLNDRPRKRLGFRTPAEVLRWS
jgi:IS30 family transposase